jgi:hypothetical protein
MSKIGKPGAAVAEFNLAVFIRQMQSTAEGRALTLDQAKREIAREWVEHADLKRAARSGDPAAKAELTRRKRELAYGIARAEQRNADMKRAMPGARTAGS